MKEKTMRSLEQIAEAAKGLTEAEIDAQLDAVEEKAQLDDMLNAAEVFGVTHVCIPSDQEMDTLETCLCMACFGMESNISLARHNARHARDIDEEAAFVDCSGNDALCCLICNMPAGREERDITVSHHGETGTDEIMAEKVADVLVSAPLVKALQRIAIDADYESTEDSILLGERLESIRIAAESCLSRQQTKTNTARCQNCDWSGPVALLKPVQDLLKRVRPGEPMPAGECPACKALVHLTEQEIPKLKQHPDFEHVDFLEEVLVGLDEDSPTVMESIRSIRKALTSLTTHEQNLRTER